MADSKKPNSWIARMGRNFDDYPGFQPFRSWANTYAQDCTYILNTVHSHTCGTDQY